MARRGAPALYELMRKPGAAAGASPSPRASGPARGPRMGQAPAIPDSFTVTIGQAALIGIGVIVAISIAFGIGIQRGRSTASSTAPVAEAGSSSTAPSIDPGSAKQPPAPKASTVIANNNGDPRIKGYRYFVLAHPSSQRAREMLDFCNKNGLEAYLVPDDNAMLRKIIVLPGYKDSSERTAPQFKDLEAKIKRAGEKWKAAAKGNQDFSGYYPELFR
jgi:hypothetical protein